MMNKDKAKGKVRQCGQAHLRGVERLFREGTVVKRAETYVRRCRVKTDGRVRFPNLTGFCRVLGIGMEEMSRLGIKYPKIYDAILAVLEDGALNAECVPAKSALLAMTYFRRRLGYEVAKAARAEESAGPTRVIFEHDIGEDGK